jgi:hypothetical protein
LKIKSIKEISLIAHSKSRPKKYVGGNKKKLSSFKLPTTTHN